MAEAETAGTSTTAQKVLGVAAIGSLAATTVGFSGPADISVFAEKVGIPFTIIVIGLYGLRALFNWFTTKVAEPLVESQRAFVAGVQKQNERQTEALMKITTSIETISDAVCQQGKDTDRVLGEIKDAVERQTQRYERALLKDVA